MFWYMNKNLLIQEMKSVENEDQKNINLLR